MYCVRCRRDPSVALLSPLSVSLSLPGLCSGDPSASGESRAETRDFTLASDALLANVQQEGGNGVYPAYIYYCYLWCVGYLLSVVFFKRDVCFRQKNSYLEGDY